MSKRVDVAVIKEFKVGHDRGVTSSSCSYFPRAEPVRVQVTFSPDQASGEGGVPVLGGLGVGKLRGYYLATYWDGGQTWAMNGYPPRLSVN